MVALPVISSQLKSGKQTSVFPEPPLSFCATNYGRTSHEETLHSEKLFRLRKELRLACGDLLEILSTELFLIYLG